MMQLLSWLFQTVWTYLIPEGSTCSVFRKRYSLLSKPRSHCLVCVQYNTRKWKTGNAWEHLLREWRLVDGRWSWGRGSRSNDVRSDSQDCQYSSSPVRILLYRLLHSSWLMGSCPTNVIHVIGVSSFSGLFRFRVLYCTKTEEQKT